MTGEERTEAALTVHEWRVTGQPNGDYPAYDFTFRSDREEWLGDLAEAKARDFIAGIEGWEDGPHLTHRVVTYGAWEAVTDA